MCYDRSMDYEQKNIVDKIALVGELEHARRHAERSAVVALVNGEDFVPYLLTAKRAQELRRKIMAGMNLDDKDHCLCKVGACIRQLAYEVDEGDYELLKELDAFVDDIWGKALNMDLTGCKSCADDKSVVKKTTKS